MSERTPLRILESPASAAEPRLDLETLRRGLGRDLNVLRPGAAPCSDPPSGFVLLLPPQAEPDVRGLAHGLETLERRAELAGLAQLSATDGDRSLPFELLLRPETVGALLMRWEVARACDVELPGTGTLARAWALLRILCSFEIQRAPRALSLPHACSSPTPDERTCFGRTALGAFAIEELRPELRAPGANREAYVNGLLECASELLAAGRLAEGFRLGVRAQELADAHATARRLPHDPDPAPPAADVAGGLLREGVADPEVSLIVPTYGRPTMLARALESIGEQELADLEVIIVNDGGPSPEGVVTLHRQRIGGGGRITLVNHDRNRGLAAARNTGLRLARGRFVGFLDDDDLLLPHHLSALLPRLRLGAGVAHADVRSVIESPERSAPRSLDLALRYQFDYDPQLHRIDNTFPVQSFLVERKLLEEAGAFDETLPVLEDWDLWLRVWERAQPVHVRRVTSEIHVRSDGSNMTGRSHEIWLEILAWIYGKTLRFEHESPSLRADRVRYLLELSANRSLPFPREARVWLSGDAELLAIDPEAPGAFLAASFRVPEAPRHDVRTANPRCAIVIPVWNRLDLTEQCLKHLFEVRTNTSFELIVVDNGSSDGTTQFLRSLGPRLRIIRNERNLGFARACNQGAAVAKAPYLLFLNNDTIPLPGWLEPLLAIVEREPTVSVVGSKLLFPDGSIQHAGVAMSRLHRTPYHIYRSVPGSSSIVNRRRDLHAVTGACMLVRATAFREVGGFDEGYVNSFEDVDLCFRLVQRGHHVVYEPQSTLYHLESQTPTRRDHDRRNIERFLARWPEPWWIDEEGIFAEDGYVVVREPGGGLRCFASERERASWLRVAEVQRRAAREGVPALRSLLEDPTLWPTEREILLWGENLCIHGGLPELAPRFRAVRAALRGSQTMASQAEA
ncbi:MAG: glycosyltransferase [Myxococcota bacterium]